MSMVTDAAPAEGIRYTPTGRISTEKQRAATKKAGLVSGQKRRIIASPDAVELRHASTILNCLVEKYRLAEIEDLDKTGS